MLKPVETKLALKQFDEKLTQLITANWKIIASNKPS